MATYVSSKLRHRYLWVDNDIETSSSWIDSHISDPTSCTEMWDRYAKEIAESENLVAYLEQEDTPKGMLLEIGCALSHNKPIIIVWSGTIAELARKCGSIVFHDNVKIVDTIEAAKKLI